MKSEIQKALGGDSADQLADLLKFPFLLAGVMIKRLGQTVGKLLAKIATLGLANSEIDEAFASDDGQAEQKLKKVLNDILGGKVYLTIGPREHTDGNAFFSKMEKHREVIFKEIPERFVSKNEAEAAKNYKKWFREQPHL